MRRGFFVGSLLVAVFALLAVARAQVPSAFFDYKERLRAGEMMAPLGSEAFGEQISLFNGATEFAATDVDLPGNNALPVRIGRRFKVDVKDRGHTSGGFSLSPAPLGGFGWWDIDVPYVYAVVDSAFGWAGHGNDTRRCSGPILPRVIDNFEVNEIFTGVRLHIPWAGEQELTLLSGHPVPADGNAYRWGTRDNYRARCLASVANYAGEGFLVVDPQGVKYKFDVAVFRDAGALEKRVGAGVYAHTVKRAVYLFVSQIEDRFGNVVTYHYSGDRLVRISSNDGREINLHWSGNSVSRVTAHDREWTYSHTTNTLNVQLPDGTAWRYQAAGALKVTPAPIQDGSTGDSRCIEPLPDTAEGYSMSVTHPSGATAKFDFGYSPHRRSGTPANACTFVYTDSTTGAQIFALGTPDYAHVYSVARKMITGPGVPSMVWEYGYDPPTTGRANFSGAYCGSCDIDKSTYVRNPDGSETEHIFGALWNFNEGVPLGTRTRDSRGVVVKEELLGYVSDSEVQGMPFKPDFGTFTMSDNGAVLKNRPLKERIVRQDGADFRHAVNTFDVFARPLSVTKSSTLSGNQSRTEATAYHDDLPKWVLGQRARLTVNDIVVSETRYSPSAQPTVSKHFGRTVQTLGYNADGTVASVRDGNNHVTTLSGWKRGIPQTIRYPATPESPSGATQSAVVNDSGWITRVTDENGYATNYWYDPMGRLNRIVHPTGDNVAWNDTTLGLVRTTASAYGIAAGHWQHTVATGNGRKVTYLDALFRPLLVREYDTGNASGTQRFVRQAFDYAGRTTFASYPSASGTPTTGTWTEYDALGRPTSVSQDSELSLLTTTTAYLTGFQTRSTSPKGYQSTTSYLAWDEPTTDYPVAIAHPAGAFTDIARDVFGKPTALTRRDAGGTTTLTRRYVYDAHQQLCKSIEPETGATIMAYDGAGNLAWSKAGATQTGTASCNTADIPVAQRTVRSYDARNRIQALAFPDNRGNTGYGYTPDGLLASITMDNGGADFVSTAYSYNRRRLLVGEALGVGSHQWGIGYGYDANGHLATLTLPGGETVNHAPNALGQPTRAGNHATGVTYFPNGAIKQFTYGHGIVHTLAQNARGLPDRSRDAHGSTSFRDDSLDYDGHGNVAAISDGLAGARGNRTMSYDALDRLTQTVSPMFGTAAYTYDVLDNLRRVRITAGAKARDHTYVYDASQRLGLVTNTSGGATVASLGYDAQGNLASRNGQAYQFDFGNRLRNVSGAESYLYDGHGRRVKATRSDGGAIYSVYGQDGVLRYQRDERTGKTTEYVHLGGSLVAALDDPIALSTPTLTVPGYSATGSYTVSWTASALATKYQLQERLGTGSWSTIHDAAGTSRAVSGKAAGSWSYQVRACSAATCGSWSAVATTTVQLPPAAAPTLTAPATGANGAYTVNWTSVAAATKYQLQERQGTGSWSTIHDAAGTSRAVSGKAAGNWSYQVRACNDAGCSAWSSLATVSVIHPPGSAPTLAAPAANFTGSYSVTWALVSTATRYELQERLGTGSWSTIHNAAGTSRAVSGKTAGTWSYQIRACNEAACSGWSAARSTVVTLPPTAAPTLTLPATNTTGGYTVSWSVVATATRYELRERLGTGAWSTIHDAAGTSRAVSGKTTGSWGYQARGCNVGGCGGWSAVGQVSVTRPPTSAPTITVPSSSNSGAFNVTWNAVSTATRYELEQQLGTSSWTQVQDASSLSAFVSGRSDGTWRYRVRACNVAGCGAYSAAASVQVQLLPVGAPTLSGPGLVNVGAPYAISWTAVQGGSTYELQEQVHPLFDPFIPWWPAYQGGGTSMSFGGRGGGIYEYRVRACNAAGCSGWSGVFTMEVRAPGCQPPECVEP